MVTEEQKHIDEMKRADKMISAFEKIADGLHRIADGVRR